MKLSSSSIAARLARLPGWSRRGDAIVRQFAFPAFADAIAFTVRIGFEAEAADHHPDLLVSYRRVTVTWSTHSAGGVTTRDFDGARQADRVAETLGGK